MNNVKKHFCLNTFFNIKCCLLQSLCFVIFFVKTLYLNIDLLSLNTKEILVFIFIYFGIVKTSNPISSIFFYLDYATI